MKSLTCRLDYHVNDNAALSLAAALFTTSTSMKVMKLSWTSTLPDITLKKMGECIKKSASTLRELELNIDAPQPLGEPQVSVMEAREWYRRVEIGGGDFILSLENCRLKNFSLTHYNLMSSIHDLKSQVRMSLEEATTSVNLTRKMNYLPEIKFLIRIE